MAASGFRAAVRSGDFLLMAGFVPAGPLPCMGFLMTARLVRFAKAQSMKMNKHGRDTDL
jgi:hypothetical protein